MVTSRRRRGPKFPLYFRLPSLVRVAVDPLNGEDVPPTSDGRGFVRIARSWKAGDRVEVAASRCRSASRAATTTASKVEMPAAMDAAGRALRQHLRRPAADGPADS